MKKEQEGEREIVQHRMRKSDIIRVEARSGERNVSLRREYNRRALKGGMIATDKPIATGRPRLRLKKRTKPISWPALHLGRDINHGTYGIISEYVDTLTSMDKTRILSRKVNANKVVKHPIRTSTFCPKNFRNEHERHRQVMNVVLLAQVIVPNFSFSVPDLYQDVPIWHSDSGKCYYVMQRLYPAAMKELSDTVPTDRIGQLYFQKKDEPYSLSKAYDGYELGLASIAAVAEALGLSLEKIVSDMGAFVGFCYLNLILPEDVEYIVGRTLEGKPRLFIIDFDKVVTFEAGDRLENPEVFLARLNAHLSYPDSGELKEVFENSFHETILNNKF